MRIFVVAATLGVLVLAGLQPAAAASRPSQVGIVSFVGADYSRSKNTGSLSLDWPDARRAKKYQVFMSRSYSMKKARTFTVRSSKITVAKLARGKDYFFQVRGVNGKKHGTRSKRVGHTTIVRPGPTSGMIPLRVMTYNVCSDVCDTKQTTPYPWKPESGDTPARQPRAFERIAAASPDIIAAQESHKMGTPDGYTTVFPGSVSAKNLFIKTSRFAVAEGPAYAPGPQDELGCRATTAVDSPTGHVFLGRHGGGCRYATWTELVDITRGKHFVVVNVHTVSGTSSTAVSNRRAEMSALFSAIRRVNAKDLPVVFAGDFNSHKNRPDVVGSAMSRNGFRDAYDLARTLQGQHLNSYNDFSSRPRLSYKWGDHVDHVYVNPWDSRVDAWRNIVLIGPDGRLVQPIPSDHSPLIVDVRIS